MSIALLGEAWAGHMAIAKAQVLDLSMVDNKQSNVDLEQTVGAFATRIARKLKERDAQQSESEKAAEVRHNLILEAMNTIRKALQETLRINLGDRFNLDLWVDDWDGWPRVQLVLVDRLAPNRVDYALIVSANDRKETGVIEMNTRSGVSLGKIDLIDRAGLTRLALSLKKAVRQFLDSVAAYVLNPVREEDLVETLSKPIESEDLDPVQANLHSADVFAEHRDYSKDNVISTDAHEKEAQAVEIGDLFSDNHNRH